MTPKKTKKKLIPVKPVEAEPGIPVMQKPIKMNLKKLQKRPIREHRTVGAGGHRASQRSVNTASPTGRSKAVISVANFVVSYTGSNTELRSQKWYVCKVPGPTDAIRSILAVMKLKGSPTFTAVEEEGTRVDLGDDGWASTAYGTVQEIIEVEDDASVEVDASLVTA